MKEMDGYSTGSQLTASDFNQPMTETENVIEGAGIVLSGADVTQLHQGVSHHVASSDWYTCSGTSTAYIATPVGAHVGPPALSIGMRVRLRPHVDNTSAAPTLNVAGLGAHTILRESGGVLSTSPPDIDMDRDCEFRYMMAGGFWLLLNRSLEPNPEPGSVYATRGYIDGLLHGNASGDAVNDIDVGPGQCRDSSNSYFIASLATLTKRIDAVWAQGSGQGGFPTTGLGAVANSTWYRQFAIGKTNGTLDVGWDSVANADAADLLAEPSVAAAGFTIYRQIGWTYRTAGSANRLYHQNAHDPDRILYDSPIVDVYDASTPTVRGTGVAVSCPPSTIWSGQMFMTYYGGLQHEAILSDMSAADVLPSVAAYNGYVYSADQTNVSYEIPTDATSKIGVRFSDAGGNYNLVTLGYRYGRGRA